MKVVLGDLIIDPQRGGYEFYGPPPRRIGDECHICPVGLGYFPVHVILLADASGRQWLVSCGR